MSFIDQTGRKTGSVSVTVSVRIHIFPSLISLFTLQFVTTNEYRVEEEEETKIIG